MLIPHRAHTCKDYRKTHLKAKNLALSCQHIATAVALGLGKHSRTLLDQDKSTVLSAGVSQTSTSLSNASRVSTANSDNHASQVVLINECHTRQSSVVKLVISSHCCKCDLSPEQLLLTTALTPRRNVISVVSGYSSFSCNCLLEALKFSCSDH